MASKPVGAICFYLSDYGYGHATRMVALIRTLLSIAPDLPLIIKAHTTFALLKASLPYPNVAVVRRRNDFGVLNHADNPICPDRVATAAALEKWVDGWDEYVSEEVKFCRAHGVGLIISDVPPQAMLVAATLGIPSIAISNFHWHQVYQGLLGNSPLLGTLQEAYQQTTLALCLPLSEDMSLFPRRKDVGLLSRRITRDRQAIRRLLGVGKDELLVYLAIGRSIAPAFLRPVVLPTDRRNVRFLVSAHVAMPGAVALPPHDPESQDYVAACDLVISKAGYSVLSEAIVGQVPIFLFGTIIENDILPTWVSTLGIGGSITPHELLNGSWVHVLDKLDALKRAYTTLPQHLQHDGAIEIAREVLGQLGHASLLSPLEVKV